MTAARGFARRIGLDPQAAGISWQINLEGNTAVAAVAGEDLA